MTENEMPARRSDEENAFRTGFRNAIGELDVAIPELDIEQVFALFLTQRAADAGDDLAIVGHEASRKESPLRGAFHETIRQALLVATRGDEELVGLVMELRPYRDSYATVLGAQMGLAAAMAELEAQGKAADDEDAARA